MIPGRSTSDLNADRNVNAIAGPSWSITSEAGPSRIPHQSGPGSDGRVNANVPTSSESNSTSSPYTSSSSDISTTTPLHKHLPLDKQAQHPFQRQIQSQLHSHPPQHIQQSQAHSPYRSQLQSLHHPPVIPSTFLPSHYSESRFPSSSSPCPPSFIELVGASRHTPSAWEKMSRSGPSPHDLLDGVRLPSPSPPPWSGISSNGGTPMMELAGLPHVRNPPYTTAAGDGGGGGGGSSNTSMNPGWVTRGPSQMSWLSQTQTQSQSQAGPSSTPASVHSHQPSQSPVSASPMTHQRSISNASASPHTTHLVPPLPPQSQSSPSYLSPRFHPYSKPRIPSSSSASPAQSQAANNGGNMGPPPQPPTLGTTGRSWSEPVAHEPVTISAGYPGSIFGSVPLPEGYNTQPAYGGRSIDEIKVGQEEYAQALAIYNHLLSALPHIVSNTSASPDAPAYPGVQQSFDSLVSLASDGLGLLTGQIPITGAPGMLSDLQGSASGLGRGQGANMGSGFDESGTENGGGNGVGNGNGNGSGVGVGAGAGGSSNEKKATKCLGCGATETPEWRRGPMGPRTLCNACGLVHMKLQRKKKKAEEKARIAAAAAADPGPGNK